jgi:NADPH:quinone reductase-like Zn-dependent oxidoreductase
VLTLDDAADPVIGDGQVLVAVHAAAITFDELTWDLSWETTDGRDRLPVIPAHEMAGVVVRRSPDVDTLEIGAEVFGLVPFDRDGAAAELLAIEAALIARKPRHATWAESASLALAGLTALQALADHAQVTAGERVLVQGGAGGVGTMAVQLAVWLGADVSATASSPNLELVRSLGAVEAFDRDTDDVTTALPFDVVIDTVGGATLASSYHLVRPGGRLVTLSAPPDQDEARRAGVSAVFFVVAPSRMQLGQLADLVDEGAIRPMLAATFPLADGRAAFASRGTGRPGKTVLLVD